MVPPRDHDSGVRSGGTPASEATREKASSAGAPSEPDAPRPGAPDGDGQEPGPANAPAVQPQPGAQAEAPPGDHERQLELDLEELEAKAQKADEYLELAKRTKADFENYRKRATREATIAAERGVSKLARELLPAIDNLDRALASVDGDGGAETLVSGIKLVQTELMAALARVGIEPFSPEGEPFDPNRHEAMAQQPAEGVQTGTVLEVYQRGYTLGDAVLRPARVVVAG